MSCRSSNDQPHGVVADRLDRDDADMALCRGRSASGAGHGPAPRRWDFPPEGTPPARRSGTVVERDVQQRAPGLVEPDLRGDTPSLLQLARLLGQHDRNAVAHRIGQARLAADQLAGLAVILQRSLGQRTDQDFQQPRIDRRLALRLRPVRPCVPRAPPASAYAAAARRILAPARPSATVPARSLPGPRRWAPPATPASPPARTGTPLHRVADQHVVRQAA